MKFFAIFLIILLQGCMTAKDRREAVQGGSSDRIPVGLEGYPPSVAGSNPVSYPSFSKRGIAYLMCKYIILRPVSTQSRH